MSPNYASISEVCCDADGARSRVVATLTTHGARPAVPGPVIDVIGEQTCEGVRPRGQERRERGTGIAVHRSLQRGQAGPGGVLSETATTRRPHTAR